MKNINMNRVITLCFILLFGIITVAVEIDRSNLATRINNLYDSSYQYDMVIDYQWTLMYDNTTYVCSDIWNNIIVPVPCWYPEYKENECKSDF